MTEVDQIPLSTLPSRYDIARSALYTRLKDLKIEPIKQGKKAYVNSEHLQLLDELHEHISKGGTTNEFLKQRANFSTGLSRTNERTKTKSELVIDSTGQITIQPSGTLSVVEAIVNRLLPATGNRLAYLRELEEAYEKGWLLSTSEVADLLGLSPKTVREYGKKFTDAGFVFTRAGTRKGGEIAWTIDKQDDIGIQPQQPKIGIKEALSKEFDPELQ
ncbi:conserved hypothetical protein (plasmid) [Gloeothece citriformis PCC 7424]|uniref:Uncharacterized protein n=1 Tax=Gloeothece citriformis (strain PCC 7424) TaxID=65393 RepID=B7KMX8_GLOC7|nr:hypothetical protein [Gloeothece citriformis]ACK74150.1 conserved hypothetical protein [Gloeothece citriformis PCC 7424]